MIREAIYNGQILYCAIDVVADNFDTTRPARYWNDWKKRFGHKLFIHRHPVPSNKSTRRIYHVDFLNSDGVEFLLSYVKFTKEDEFCQNVSTATDV